MDPVRPVVMTLAGLAALALAASGCGGGDDEPEDPKERFLAEANAICEQLGEDSVDLVDETLGDAGKEPTPARLRAISRQSTELQRAGLADLRALTPPPGDEELVARIWDALERAIDELGAVAIDDPGEEGGPADLALNEYGALASDYGLGVCAEGI